MPELPDVAVYIDALERHVGGRTLERFRLASPFLVRSFDPPVKAIEGRVVTGFRRLGKRIVFCFDDSEEGGGESLYLVLHLMIAGRLRWKPRGVKVPRRNGLAAFDFAHGSLLLTEASSKKRASLYVVLGEQALAEHDPGGVEVLETDLDGFRAGLGRKNHTLKRALTDPRLVSGIGNAFSDEILHRARMSPFKQTERLNEGEWSHLFTTVREILEEWIELRRLEVGEGFPDKVTAFHPKMAVHGRYRKPCPTCGDPVQRLVYAENEANYCATCQTGGRLLADRALSRLLKQDWPRTLEELETRRTSGKT